MKNIKLLFLVASFLTSHIFAQEFILPLWEKSIPNHNGNKIEETYESTDIIRIQQVDKPSIEVFLPAKKNRTGEAVVICPGGGYRIIAYDWEGKDVAKWLNSNGIAAIVLKYRLPHTQNNIEGRLSPFLDLQRAVRLTRFYAERWNINPNKVGIMGFSAGGHLASTLGTHFQDNFFASDNIDSISCRPDFMILMYPVITFNEPHLHVGSRKFLMGENPDKRLIYYYSNELHVNEKTPPTFLTHAEDDGAVPVENSLMFFEQLKKHNVPAEMHIFPKGGHGFSLATGNESLSAWTDLCIKWIRNTTTKVK
ncbi:MAG: alpha/beta hydrolase [Ignavibacteriaceae bacterium]|nr:alpha/beta hydrolase [Ignavibacteriaceae bacterium]